MLTVLAIAAFRSSGTPRYHAPIMTLQPGGADLQGGKDMNRNAEVAALKRLFYDSEDSAEPQADESRSEALKLGLHLDVPLARWNVAFLPHQQARLSQSRL